MACVNCSDFILVGKVKKVKGRAFGSGVVEYRGEILPTSGKLTYHLDVKKIINSSIVMGITDGEVSVKDEVVNTVKSLGWGFCLPCYMQLDGNVLGEKIEVIIGSEYRQGVTQRYRAD